MEHHERAGNTRTTQETEHGQKVRSVHSSSRDFRGQGRSFRPRPFSLEHFGLSSLNISHLFASKGVINSLSDPSSEGHFPSVREVGESGRKRDWEAVPSRDVPRPAKRLAPAFKPQPGDRGLCKEMSVLGECQEGNNDYLNFTNISYIRPSMQPANISARPVNTDVFVCYISIAPTVGSYSLDVTTRAASAYH